MAKQPRRPNKLPEFEGDEDEKLAADRQSEPKWPANDYIFGAALMLAGVIVLIAIAVATGLVKP